MYKIHNVLSNQERKKIIKDVKPLLMDSEQLQRNYNHSYDYPGKQTDSQLHLRPQFSSAIKKILDKVIKETGIDLLVYQSWVKWSNGREDQMNWHSHYPLQPVSFASVYYLKTLPFFSNGTLFEDGFVQVPQNSMIIFPAHLLHTTPKYPFPFIDRYVMSINLNIRNSG
tara:strand:+ start:52 stop:558 length:507 start_codon:yes stop_codon:yes gene_type:complete